MLLSVYKIWFIEFDFSNIMVLLLNKSNSTMVISLKLAIFDDNRIVLLEFFNMTSCGY